MNEVSYLQAAESTISEKLQEKLHPHHLQVLLEGSAIYPEVVAERGCYTTTIKADLERKGFSRNQQLVPGIVFPIHGPDGEEKFHFLRPDSPRYKDGKPHKYEFPRGQSMAMDVPPRCKKDIDDPTVPLWITEGPKKADSGASRGLCMLDIIGVWNWRGTNPKGGKTVLPELDLIAWKDRQDNPRKVFLAFDSDIMQKMPVYQALERLRELLNYKGADVWIIYLPSGEGGKKVGLDDFFAADPSRSVDDLISYAQKELKKPPTSEHHSEHNRVAEALDDAPGSGDLLIPLGYEVGMGGVSALRIDPNTFEERRTFVAHAPVFIAGRMSDIHDGGESVELVFRRAGGWRRHTIERSTIASKGEIVKLASVGLPVTSGNAGAMVEYLAEFENTNIERLPHARVSGQMGWQGRKGERGFLWGRQLLGAGEDLFTGPAELEEISPEKWPKDLICFRGADSGDDQLAAGFHASGTFEGWQETITALKPYPRVRLALYGALCAPLLKVLGASNFIMDWSYPTSTGKTTTLRVGASCWGNPDERSPETVIGSWDATRVWIERAGASLNNLPLILDETKRARYPSNVGQTLYDVASGRGRGRGSKRGMGRAGNWSTVLLSTGEQPATTFTEDGGTRARTLVLWGPPFGSTDEKTALLVNKLNLGILQNYGHAGPRLIHYLMATQDKWEELRTQYQDYRQRYLEMAKGDPVLGRFADYLAVLTLTAWLVTEAGIVPWEYENPIEPLWETLSAEMSEADRAKHALDSILSWAYANEHAFHGRERKDQNDNPIAPSGGFAGRWDDDSVFGDNNWSFIAFYPHVLKKLLKDQGHEFESILRSWRDRGWLDTSGDRKRLQKKVRVSGQERRMVAIKRSAIEDSLKEEEG
jgi:putative DNA primase/helicase